MHTMSTLLARSAAAIDGLHTLDEVEAWFDDCRAANQLEVTPRSLSDLPGWHREPSTGDYVHASGRFFRITAIEVSDGQGTRRQPIIEQPEIGILGFLVKTFDGIPHLLVQAKIEPGNQSGLQLAPTIQATRSNSSRVHGGRAVPYLEYFQYPERRRVLVDTLQSEQGWWFYQKRNRNIVVWTPDDVPVHEGFCWMTLAQLFHFLDTRDIMNMDARSVLGCIPCYGPAESTAGVTLGDQHHTDTLCALSTARTTTDMTVRRIGLNQLWGWHETDTRFVSTDAHGDFEIMGFDVRGLGREVVQWSQPLLRPLVEGRFELLVRRAHGRLECLFALAAEPGLADIVELAPTRRPASHGSPAFPELGRTRVLYDQVQSEEGGRFYHALSRYVVRELVSDDHAAPAPEGFVWLPFDLVQSLISHPRYLTVEARSLLVCLQRALVHRDSTRALPPVRLSRSDLPRVA